LRYVSQSFAICISDEELAEISGIFREKGREAKKRKEKYKLILRCLAENKKATSWEIAKYLCETLEKDCSYKNIRNYSRSKGFTNLLDKLMKLGYISYDKEIYEKQGYRLYSLTEKGTWLAALILCDFHEIIKMLASYGIISSKEKDALLNMPKAIFMQVFRDLFINSIKDVIKTAGIDLDKLPAEKAYLIVNRISVLATDPSYIGLTIAKLLNRNIKVDKPGKLAFMILNKQLSFTEKELEKRIGFIKTLRKILKENLE